MSLLTNTRNTSLIPNFNVLSRWSSEYPIDIVRYGANANVLESELNEAQQVANYKLAELIRLSYTEGFEKPESAVSLSGSTLTVADTHAYFNGVIYYISKLTLIVSNGDEIYLDTWVEPATKDSVIRKYGNAQESSIFNYIEDPLLGVETSMRQLNMYNLSKENTAEGHTYMHLGTILNGQFVSNISPILNAFSSAVSSSEESYVAEKDQTLFNLNGKYIIGKGQIAVFMNGIRMPEDCFEETSETSVTFKSGVPYGTEVMFVY